MRDKSITLIPTPLLSLHPSPHQYKGTTRTDAIAVMPNATSDYSCLGADILIVQNWESIRVYDSLLKSLENF